MRLNLFAACAAVVVGGIASIGSAAIAVPDGGFEADTNTGWHQFDNPNSGQWTLTPSASITNGAWWGNGIYGATDGQGTPTEGVHFLSIYPGQAPTTGVPYGKITLQGASFPVTTTAGALYTAAVDIARCPASNTYSGGSTDVTINLMEGTTVLATGTGSIGTPDVWSNVAALPYTATDSAVHNLSIQIVMDNFVGDNGSWKSTNVNLDNVTLTVPEPAMMSLIGMSGLGLLARRRK